MRFARSEQECPLCGGWLLAGDPIAGAVVGDMIRWVHPACAPRAWAKYEPQAPDEPLQPVLSRLTPADDQADALRWARAQLAALRASGWEGDEAAELARLRASWRPGR